MYVLAPVRVSRPGPLLVSPVAPPLFAITEPMVNPLPVLFWMTTKSPLAEPSKVLPVIVDKLLPTLLVTRMPPEVSELVAARVTVFAAVVLNRKLLVVRSDAARHHISI